MLCLPMYYALLSVCVNVSALLVKLKADREAAPLEKSTKTQREKYHYYVKSHYKIEGPHIFRSMWLLEERVGNSMWEYSSGRVILWSQDNCEGCYPGIVHLYMIRGVTPIFIQFASNIKESSFCETQLQICLFYPDLNHSTPKANC